MCNLAPFPRLNSIMCNRSYIRYFLVLLLSKIRSGSNFLLSSTGSFKRFDSVDRDCKQEEGGGSAAARFSPAPSNTTTSAVSPLWNLPGIVEIPGQPLRPAPSPPPPPLSAQTSVTTPNKLHFFSAHSPTTYASTDHDPSHHPHPIRQQR